MKGWGLFEEVVLKSCHRSACLQRTLTHRHPKDQEAEFSVSGVAVLVVLVPPQRPKCAARLKTNHSCAFQGRLCFHQKLIFKTKKFDSSVYFCLLSLFCSFLHSSPSLFLSWLRPEISNKCFSVTSGQWRQLDVVCLEAESKQKSSPPHSGRASTPTPLTQGDLAQLLVTHPSRGRGISRQGDYQCLRNGAWSWHWACISVKSWVHKSCSVRI